MFHSLFDWFAGLVSTDIGIDLGTANTLVYVPGAGIIISEPSVVAVSKRDGHVLRNGQAVGFAAAEMLGKTPGTVAAVRPMKGGVIADFDITEAMLRYFIKKAGSRRWGAGPRIVIAIPSGITPVERRAVLESARRAGARRVYTIEEPKAAGIGAGLPITEPVGNMIVDIGGGTTEVAVISLGGLASSQSVRIAGDQFDEAIIAHMKHTYNLEIGPQTAERVKLTIGSAYPLEEELTMEVKGRHHLTGLPSRETVSSEEIREALREPVEAIVQAVRTTLERTPPELAADIVDRGMVLAGGGSLLRGLDKCLMEKTDLPVRIANDPLTCVARGTGEVLDKLDILKDYLYGDDEND